MLCSLSARKSFGVAAVCALLASGAMAEPSLATTSGPGPLWGASCYKVRDANSPYFSSHYVYGATNVDAQAGNASLTANESASGTVTVFRADSADDDNQMNYFATGYQPTTGQAIGARPNAGSFLGIRYRTGRGASSAVHFAWLRTWPHEQRYLSDMSPVPVTTYIAPGNLGLIVTDTDLATAGSLHALDRAVRAGGPDVFVRHLVVSRAAGSPVVSASLVAYGNFSPIGSEVPYIPFEDSGCATQANLSKVGSYSISEQLATVSWSGVDLLTGQPATASVAMGFDGQTSRYQIGADSQDPLAPPGRPDGYEQLEAAPYRLGDSTADAGQPTIALERPLVFGPTGIASARLYVAAEPRAHMAVAQIVAARQDSFDEQLAQVEAAWQALFRHVPLPATQDSRVVEVAERSVITMLLAIDPRTGAIVASSDTQGPYGEDWIRDGSFINAALDENGFVALATRHDLFYARTQSAPDHPLPGVPFGNWPMNMYMTGQPGGPIPWEIDETGYGAWTLWRQARFVPAQGRIQYLHEVFPAIARAADFLLACQDPDNGFQCAASEDDNFTPSQTLHGALPDLLALRSAVAAATVLGDHSTIVDEWQARAQRLQQAIDSLYDPEAHAYREGPSSTEATPVNFEDGGLMLWPTQLHPYANPTMEGEAAATQTAMDASFDAAGGDYEGVALLGLCHADRGTAPAQLGSLRQTLDYMANTLTTSTGLFGEGWLRWGDGRITPLNDQPHVWEHALFDMSALCLDGSS